MNRIAVVKELVAIVKLLNAMDFATDEAMRKYIKDHPSSDKSKHKVVKDGLVPVSGHPKGGVKTMDNPLNIWVRSVEDGEFYRTK